MWRTPIPGAAPRVCQGLDLEKIVTLPYIPFWKTREKHTGGYHYGERNMQPHVNALSPEEMVTYYDNTNFFNKFSYGELLRAYGLRFGRGYIYYMTFPALVIVLHKTVTTAFLYKNDCLKFKIMFSTISVL